MKQLITINNGVVIATELVVDMPIDAHRHYINSEVKKKKKKGNLYENPKDSKSDYVGEWELLDIESLLKNLSNSELQDIFVEKMEVSHLCLDLLEELEKASENKYRKFMTNKLKGEFTKIELARMLCTDYE